MKARNILFLFLIAIMFVIDACKDKGVEPLPLKSPRDYTWTADTITYLGSYTQTIMDDIWGSSPNDVYGVGFNNGSNVTIWHYDGKSWADVKLDTFGMNPIVLFGIYGFSSKDIWAVGGRGDLNAPSSGSIIHYDGSKWSEVDMNRAYTLNDINGSSPNDIWACGWGGVVYHFDGIKWNKDSISVYNPQVDEYQLLSITESKNTVYAIGEKHENNLARDTYYFFKKSNQLWQTIDSFVVAPGQTTFKFGTRLWTSPEGNLYSGSDGLFKWNGSSWDNIYYSSIALPCLFGTSEQNIFVVGNYGIVLHYNGSDWYQFQQLKDENIVYTGVWTDGKEAFICGYNTDSYPMKTIVWHGK